MPRARQTVPIQLSNDIAGVFSACLHASASSCRGRVFCCRGASVDAPARTAAASQVWAIWMKISRSRSFLAVLAQPKHSSAYARYCSVKDTTQVPSASPDEQIFCAGPTESQYGCDRKIVDPQGSAMRVTPVETYRMYAAIAGDMAAESTDPGRRVSLLEMARAWRALADKEEGSHVAQQQQQPQPDNENEK